MSNQLKSDAQILEMIGARFNTFRLHRGLRDQDVMEAGGVSKATLHKFKNQGGNITLENFIKILRATGELDSLNLLFQVPKSVPKLDKEPQKSRVRQKVKANPIEWKE
jgi:DNA-binding Xre family transcriptional regulator